jgi:hypothetical protein
MHGKTRRNVVKEDCREQESEAVAQLAGNLVQAVLRGEVSERQSSNEQ